MSFSRFASPGVVALFLQVMGSSPALAQETEAAPEEEAGGIGLNLDLLASSAYVFRGANLFGYDADGVLQQMALHPLVAPSLTVSGDRGVYAGMFWAFQTLGDNRQLNVESGYGNEMDLYLGWDGWSFAEEAFSVAPMLTAYTYPFSTSEAAGAYFATWMEPSVALTWSTAVDVGLNVAYCWGLQAPDTSYAYFGPSVSTEIALGDSAALTPTVMGGYKLFRGGSQGVDNVLDVEVDVELSWSPTDWLYLTPAVHGAWTNLVDRPFSEEYVAWGSLNVGTDL